MQMQQELKGMGDKINELEMDADEHRLVLAAMEPLDANRKCYRRIGGVLVESTVKDTQPVLLNNLQGVCFDIFYSFANSQIQQTISKLQEAWKLRDQELSSLRRDLQ